MKYLFVSAMSFLFATQSCKTPSQATPSAIPSMTVVSFNSICCGVRDDSFLKTFFESFKKQQEVKLDAAKVTACGKEGEYKVIFHTKGLSYPAYKKFSEQLKAVVDDETIKNAGNQQGTVNIETMDSINVSYCRGGEVVF